jgi:opacity protein-like surface antigen
MKKHLLIMAIVSAFMITAALQVQAQAQPRTEVEVEIETREEPKARSTRTGGIKGGLTYSNVYIDLDDVHAQNARSGFHAGFFSQVMVAETIGLQPEILFTTKGTSAQYTGVINQRVEFNLNYVDIPLYLVYRPMEGLEFHAGPYIGLLLPTNINLDNGIDGNRNLDRDHFYNLDWGVGGGLQFNFRYVILGARYNLGLQEIADSNTSRSLMGNAKHNFAQFYIAFGLPRILR